MMDPVMALLERSSSPLDAAAGHAEYVYSVAEGATSAAGIEVVASSWQRSANKYRVDPVDTHALRILTSGELKDFRGSLDKLMWAGCGQMRMNLEAPYFSSPCRARKASSRALPWFESYGDQAES
jgi:hypothetical protein